LKVAVAVWIVPSVLVASAMMVAPPLPYAVTIPAEAPVFPPELVSTGKTLGKVEIQVSVGEFVRSLTYGAVENVPIAKNCPDPCKLRTVSEFGIIVSESRGSGAGVEVTVTEAVAVNTLAGVEPEAGFVHSAVMVVDPTLTPLTTPFPEGSPEVIEAYVGMLEVHVSCGEFVTSWIRPELPYVARAINWPVWPEADSDSVPGVMDSAVTAWAPPPLVTVKDAEPATTVRETGLVYRAVTVTVPWLTAVASPGTVPVFSGLPTVAICTLLELQVDRPVRSTVAPDEVVPIAMNWLVSGGAATV
jgi:hypothetical protein